MSFYTKTIGSHAVDIISSNINYDQIAVAFTPLFAQRNSFPQKFFPSLYRLYLNIKVRVFLKFLPTSVFALVTS